jgi:phytoene dehydrogenase-like protein
VRTVVVGAGLSGLAAANDLAGAGHEVAVFEASDGVGGRVRTDSEDGFLLDRGFQILLTAYPEAQALLDYDALDLRSFTPGAQIHLDGQMHRIGDPIRDPSQLLSTAKAPIGSVLDKARILAFLRAVNKGTLDDLWKREDTTALVRLEDAGFSSTIIERFLRPLFAGITLDPQLGSSSRHLEFVFRMLAAGEAAVPANGMGEIAKQLAQQIPSDGLHLNMAVHAADATSVTLRDGTRIEADAVVIATDPTSASALADSPDPGWRGVTTIWMSAPEPPVIEPVLTLNGEGVHPINSVAVMSQVSGKYSPADRALVAVSSPHVEGTLVDAMRTQVRTWFGPIVDHWEVLRVDEITRAQPRQLPGFDAAAPLKLPSGVWICGDHRRDASINGALRSGRAVAKAVMAQAK